MTEEELPPFPSTCSTIAMVSTQMRSSIRSLLFLAGLLFTFGCDPTVDVVRPSDQYQYSLFGTLNVAADTQVIRVDPHLDSLENRSPDVTVVLENLETGREVTLRDSVLTIGDDRFYNYWAPTSIAPGTTYRVTVQRENEPLTTATATTPSAPPEVDAGSISLPCVDRESGNILYVEVRGVEHLAGVTLSYAIQPPTNGSTPPPVSYTFNHSGEIERGDENFVIRIDYQPDLVSINPESSEHGCADSTDLAHSYAELVVAAGGPDWPTWLHVSLNEIARPDAFSNVTGGHGYVGGIYPDTIRVPIRTPIAR